ncbi:hypothetical protein HUU40_00375, partial [candidate division KSB1 bacterium]|nr:hypothetical protein [candidate division KSB1 bacterium]
MTTLQAQNGNPANSFEQAVWPYLDMEAKTGYPQGVPPVFSWKWKDGDSIDREGKPYANREGYAGHYVMTISSEAFAPPLYRFDGQQYHQMTADEIKCGDYVAVSINTKLNVPTDRTHTPGLYINPVGVCFVGYGAAIVNGPDAQTMFGGQQFALPPGASAMPVASAGMPGMPGQQPMPGGYAPQPQAGQMPGQQPMPGGYAP